MNIAKAISYNEREARMSGISRDIHINSKYTLCKARDIVEEEAKKSSYFLPLCIKTRWQNIKNDGISGGALS